MQFLIPLPQVFLSFIFFFFHFLYIDPSKAPDNAGKTEQIETNKRDVLTATGTFLQSLKYVPTGNVLQQLMVGMGKIRA